MFNEDTVQKLPQYKCHKIVRAAQIKSISTEFVGGTRIHFSNGDIPSAPVSKDWIAKHNPIAGGYVVVYEDGYESFSPQEQFESGYTVHK